MVDEAHNIGEGSRGARTELLLATMKRERSGTRFLLLTPFIPNAGDLAAWLDNSDSVISVNAREPVARPVSQGVP